MASEAHMSEEKAKKAMVDAARLADELRCEQELAQGFERDRKLHECQVKDFSILKLFFSNFSAYLISF